METYHTYKSFGVTYFSFGGNTEITNQHGRVVKIFHSEGEIRGEKLAHEWIDDLVGCAA